MSFLFQFPLPFLCDLGAAEISSGLIAPDFLRPQHGCGEKAGPALFGSARADKDQAGRGLRRFPGTACGGR